MGLAAAAAACGLTHAVTVPVPSSPDATFSCALSAVNRLGFTVTTSQRPVGQIVAERRAAGSDSGETLFTDLSVYVFTRDDRTQLMVTAARSKQHGSGPRGSAGLLVLDADKQAADSVVAMCRK